MNNKEASQLALCRTLDKCGIFLSEDETFEQFETHIKELKEVKEQLLAEGNHPIDLSAANALLNALFGIKVDFVCAIYKDKKIPFWQGAATWIDPEKRVCYIQLKTGFKKGNYLFLYNREEILAHELVHATRISLGSKKYEELFAYLTSSSSFRRYFGPIFRLSYESTLFMLCTLILPLSALPLSFYLLFLLTRLVLTQRSFKKALFICEKHLKTKQAALNFMLHLTDEEIDQLTKKPHLFYAALSEGTSMRRKLLKESLFPSGSF